MSGLSALRRSGRFMVMVSRPASRFWRTISFAVMGFCFRCCCCHHRHCERSEAIQFFLVILDCFASLANDGDPNSVIPGRCAASNPEVRACLTHFDLPGLVLRTIPE